MFSTAAPNGMSPLLRAGRGLIKTGVEATLTLPPALAMLRRRVGGRAVILAYHNVIPDAEPLTGAPGAHVRRSDFRWQMDLLQEFCDVVPLDQVLEASPHPERFRAAITFDDAYAGTFREALPELRERRLPATVFVPSGLVGGGGFWWDELGVSGWEGERVPLMRLAGRTDAVRVWATEHGIEPRPQAASQVAATESEIQAASGVPGLMFGVHTVDHVNLARLTRDEVREQLVRCRSWLEARRLPTSNWVSYPYGLAAEHVEAVAAESGFAGGMTISGGVVGRRATNPFRMPRLIIPAGVSRENFLLRILGVISS